MPAAAKPRTRLAAPDPFEGLREDIIRLHDCLHEHAQKTDAGFSAIEGKIEGVREDVSELTKDVYYIKGRQDAVATRVGVPEDNAVKRTVFFTERWKAIAAVAGGGTALVGLVTAVVAFLK